MSVPTTRRAGGLWRHPDFLKLWAGQTISIFGSLIGRFALPLVAIYTLAATPFQVALVGAAGVAPGLVLGLLAGVWTDRLRRRPILIAADLGRAIVLGSVPVTAAFDLLRIEQLYVVAALTSVLSIFFDVAYRSYLPALVTREELVEGNSKLSATNSVAEIAGFGLAGVLVQVLGAPLAVLFDAISFMVSACSLAIIRTPERLVAAGHDAEANEPPPNAWREILEGLRLIRQQPILRAITGFAAIDVFFIHFFVAVLTLFLARELALSPAIQGAIPAIGGISAFIGALLAGRVIARFGLGRSLIGSFLAYRLTTFAFPFVAGPTPFVVGILGFAQCFDAAATIQQISQTSLIQATTPERLLGRFYASLQTVENTAILLGLLVGGLLGQQIGLRPTMLIGIVGSLLALPWLLRSPLAARDWAPTPPAPQEELAISK